jgi:Rrf2 family nitric oxide-sensitive transcriptional repressor
MRVLVYLTLRREKTVTIDEITDYYGISRNHLVKVVHHLSSKEFIVTSRGKNGGMHLSRSPQDISIGDVVREMEPNFNIVECFGSASTPCRILPMCNLKTVLAQATDNFLQYLDQFTLADAVKPNAKISQIVKSPAIADAKEIKSAN